MRPFHLLCSPRCATKLLMAAPVTLKTRHTREWHGCELLNWHPFFSIQSGLRIWRRIRWRSRSWEPVRHIFSALVGIVFVNSFVLSWWRYFNSKQQRDDDAETALAGFAKVFYVTMIPWNCCIGSLARGPIQALCSYTKHRHWCSLLLL